MTESHLRSIHLSEIRGEGIEIGAYHDPLPLSDEVKVSYVDSVPLSEARRLYPESYNDDAVEPDIIASAEDLSAVLEDASVDFVLCSHLLEHIPDPMGAMLEWQRVLRPGGRLFLILPDMRFTFDRFRRRTPLDHLIQDFRSDDAPGAIRRRDHHHFVEWAQRINELEDPAQAAAWGTHLQDIALPIHYHCWVLEDLRAMVEWMRDNAGLELDILRGDEDPTHREFLLSLQRPPSPAP